MINYFKGILSIVIGPKGSKFDLGSISSALRPAVWSQSLNDMVPSMGHFGTAYSHAIYFTAKYKKNKLVQHHDSIDLKSPEVISVHLSGLTSVCFISFAYRPVSHIRRALELES